MAQGFHLSPHQPQSFFEDDFIYHVQCAVKVPGSYGLVNRRQQILKLVERRSRRY